MIDIHTHILPGLDDGAEDIYDSLEMGFMAQEHGTKVIVATPHCNIPGLYSNYFGEHYKEVFLKTRKAFEREGLTVKLLPGMEVFATYDLPRLVKEGRIMTLNRTSYILVEFDFGEDPEFAEDVLMRLEEIKLRPVIAHAERYGFIQDNPEIAGDWKKRGYVIQANKGSFVGRFGKSARRTAYRLLDERVTEVIASDAHRPYMRTTDMEDTYSVLAEEYPEEYLKQLFTRNPGMICQGKLFCQDRKKRVEI